MTVTLLRMSVINFQYLEKRKEASNEEIKVDAKPKEKKEKIANYNLSKEIQRVERKIEKLEKRVTSLNEELYKKEVYMDITKSASIQQEINELTKEIAENTEEWEELVNEMQ